MKLTEIPTNTVVHTPTESEAKELLAILHENGYSWDSETFLTEKSNWSNFAEDTCYRITKYVVYGARFWYESNSDTIITLAEFKERYCEEEKPQLKLKDVDHAIVCNGFNKDGIKDGDKVFVLRYDSENFMAVLNSAIGTIIPEKNLEPYTEPETKPTENMEAKELNLVELLEGYEEEIFYHLMYGEVRYKGIDKYGLIAFTDSEIPTIYDDGKYDQDANVVLFPTRALYKQYPLDPCTAWMKWQEEQKQWKLRIGYSREDSVPIGEIIDLFFHTSTDREQAIEEIKAIIEKYSKKKNNRSWTVLQHSTTLQASKRPDISNRK